MNFGKMNLRAVKSGTLDLGKSNFSSIIRVVAAGVLMAGFGGLILTPCAYAQTPDPPSVKTGQPSVDEAPVPAGQMGQAHTGQAGAKKGHAAQSGQPAESISDKADAGPHSWTEAQLMSSTVHEAWVLSGRSEDQFFDMVQQLAAVSAGKRGLTLPESHQAGVTAGEWIKREARRDPDQLLYAVVDRAVVKVGTRGGAAAKSGMAAKSGTAAKTGTDAK